MKAFEKYRLSPMFLKTGISFKAQAGCDSS